jgi:hypothetical protein
MGETAKGERSTAPGRAKNSARQVAWYDDKADRAGFEPYRAFTITQILTNRSLGSHVSSKMAHDGSRLKTGAGCPSVRMIRPARRVFRPTDGGFAPIRRIALSPFRPFALSPFRRVAVSPCRRVAPHAVTAPPRPITAAFEQRLRSDGVSVLRESEPDNQGRRTQQAAQLARIALIKRLSQASG